MDVKQRIQEKALALGFDCAGVSPAALPREKGQQLGAFIQSGSHGDMDWIEHRADERSSPAQLWPAAQSVIVLGLNYGPDEDPFEKLAKKTTGNISVYAQNKDYHDIIKKRLKALARWIVDQWQCELKVFVDTAPVMEKPLAMQAGLGWQGKHTNLVSREFGSWLFLGEIYTTLPLTPDDPDTDHCGSCRKCIDICPTNAITEPYRLDARKCISYLTIEHKGPIPHNYRRAIGNRIYGCDDCLAICPWNKYAQATKEAKLRARDTLRSPDLLKLATLNDAQFRDLFSGSPVKRTGRNRFIRNVLIALGNSGDISGASTICLLLNDESELVRGAAIWALNELTPDVARSELWRMGEEIDQTVRAEWRLISGFAEN